jgi:hypothetical protein
MENDVYRQGKGRDEDIDNALIQHVSSLSNGLEEEGTGQVRKFKQMRDTH